MKFFLVCVFRVLSKQTQWLISAAWQVWLAATEQEMQRALARAAKDALRTYETQERPEWILEQPAQLVIVVSQMYWAVEVVKALQEEWGGIMEQGGEGAEVLKDGHVVGINERKRLQ